MSEHDLPPNFVTPVSLKGEAERAALDEEVNRALVRERQVTSVSQGRPGELLERYTTRLTGDRDDDPVPWPVVTGPRGRAVEVTGEGIIALRDRINIRDGQKYRLSARFFRHVNPSDPSGATVRVSIRWLTADYQTQSDVIVFSATLTTAMGLKSIDTTFGAGGDFEPPSGAVYAVPFIQTFDADGVTMVEQLEVLPGISSQEAMQLIIAAGAPEHTIQEIFNSIQKVDRDADRAENALSAALLAALGVGVYATPEGGIDAEDGVDEGELFWVQESEQYAALYRHDEGPVATDLNFRLALRDNIENIRDQLIPRTLSPWLQGVTTDESGRVISGYELPSGMFHTMGVGVMEHLLSSVAHPNLLLSLVGRGGRVIAGLNRRAEFSASSFRLAGGRIISSRHPEYSVAFVDGSGRIAAGMNGEGFTGAGPSSDPAPVVIPENDVAVAILEPFLDPSKNLMFTWVSNEKDAKAIVFREAPSGIPRQIVSAWTRPVRGYPGVWVHTAVLTGLHPATIYDVEVLGSTFAEKIRTAPASNIKTSVISDWQNIAGGFDSWAAQIGGLATAEESDLLFVPGDHVSDDGILDQVWGERWISYLNMIRTNYRAPGDAMVPAIYAVGNHDGRNAAGTGSANQGGDGVIGQLGDYCAWSYWPGHPTRHCNGAATFEIGTELFVIQIETDHTEPLAGPQTDWLIAQVAAAYETHKQIYIVGHAPAYYAGDPTPRNLHTHAQHLRNVIIPALAPYADKISAFFCGHTHIMAETARLQHDYDPALSADDNQWRWFVHPTEGIRQIGCGPVQAPTIRSLVNAATISTIDGSPMLLAGVGHDNEGVLETHGTLLNDPDTIYHYWVPEANGTHFRARAIDAEGNLLREINETLPAYVE